MINFSEIQPGDLLKVLVNMDDIDDETYAIAKENMKDYLVVNYYLDTSKIYKGARIYDLDENEELVQVENLCEHYPEGTSLFTDVGNSMYCISDEIDEDMDSDIIDESDEESDLEDFIVPDDEVDGLVIPPSSHREVDLEWNKWEPTSPGSRKFKAVVDSLEEFAKMHADNLNF